MRLLFVLSFIVGEMLVFFILAWSKGDYGNLADWASAIGSLGAIFFMYFQIEEQKKEFNVQIEKSEKMDEYKMRPFFSVRFRYKIFLNSESYFVNEDDSKAFESSYKEKENQATFLDGKEGYEFVNIASGVALNLVIEFVYKDGTRDVLNVDSVKPGSKCIFFTSRMLNFNTKEPDTNVTMHVENDTECIRVYFDSLLGIHYCQEWKTKVQFHDIACTNFTVTDIYKVNKEDDPERKSSTIYMGKPF